MLFSSSLMSAANPPPSQRCLGTPPRPPPPPPLIAQPKSPALAALGGGRRGGTFPPNCNMCAPGKKKGRRMKKRGSDWSLYFSKANAEILTLNPGPGKEKKIIKRYESHFLASRLIQNKNRVKTSAQDYYLPSSFARGSAAAAVSSLGPINPPISHKMRIVHSAPLPILLPFRYQSPMSNRRPPLPPTPLSSPFFFFFFFSPGIFGSFHRQGGSGVLERRSCCYCC